jgi:hypothetical protein
MLYLKGSRVWLYSLVGWTMALRSNRLKTMVKMRHRDVLQHVAWRRRRLAFGPGWLAWGAGWPPLESSRSPSWSRASLCLLESSSVRVQSVWHDLVWFLRPNSSLEFLFFLFNPWKIIIRQNSWNSVSWVPILWWWLHLYPFSCFIDVYNRS